MPQLHVAHSSLQKPSSHQGLASMDGISIELTDLLGFPGNIERLGSLCLHPEGEFKGLDPGFKSRVDRGCRILHGQLPKQFQLTSLSLQVRMGTSNVLDQFLDLGVLGVDERALERTRQKTALPVGGILDRITTRTHREESWQVLVFST